MSEVNVQHGVANHSDAELAAAIEQLKQKLAIAGPNPAIDLTPEHVQGVGQGVGHDDTQE
jgi:hypothetical protein